MYLLRAAFCFTCVCAFLPSYHAADINFALLWNKNGVASLAKSLFERLIIPSINQSCPGNAAFQSTTFNFLDVNHKNLDSVTKIESSITNLKSLKVTFAGTLDGNLIPMFETASIPSNRDDFRTMRVHTVAPIDHDAVIPGIELVINRFIPRDGLTGNNEAIFILGDEYQIHEFDQVLLRFSHGVYYYYLNTASVNTVIAKIKALPIKNIILSAAEPAVSEFIKQAYNNQLLTRTYRWFIFNSRLVDKNNFDGYVLVSKNVTSMEFGPLSTVLSHNLTSNTEIILYDLLSIWKHYLVRQFCNGTLHSDDFRFDGLTGEFTLNATSGGIERKSWKMYIHRGLGVEATTEGMWTSNGFFNMSSLPTPDTSEKEIIRSIQKNKFKVVTILGEPYVQYKQGRSNTSRNLHENLEGYTFDICMKILKDKNITNFEFFFQPDSAYGAYDAATNSWNGVVGTLIRGAANMACVPLTPTADRKQVIDFTSSHLDFPFSIIYKKKTEDPLAAMFQFINPFSYIVWASLAGVLVAMAIMLSFLHWVSPNKTDFSLYNSVFFSVASMVQGITGTPPDKFSGRLVVGFYWLFVLVILIVYVANYAAIRTLGRLQAEIVNVEDLLSQTQYEYGVTKSTSIETFFRNSTSANYQSIYKKMSEDFENGLLNTDEEANPLIETSTFAFITENPQNDYAKETKCNLVVSSGFDKSSIGLGTPKGAEYTQVFSNALETMQRSSFLTSTYSKYFVIPESKKPNCVNTTFPNVISYYIPIETGILTGKKGALTLGDTLGILLINIIGCLFTLLLALVEFVVSKCSQSISERRQERKNKKEAEEKRGIRK